MPKREKLSQVADISDCSMNFSICVMNEKLESKNVFVCKCWHVLKRMRIHIFIYTKNLI